MKITTDYLRSVMRDRMVVLDLSFSDLATLTGSSADYLSKLFRTKHSWDWTPAMRNKLCKALMISSEELQVMMLQSMQAK